MAKIIKFTDRIAYKQARNSVLIAFVLGIFISLTQIYLDFFEAQQEFNQTIDQVLQVVEGPASQAAYSLDQEVALDLLIGLFKYKPIFEAYILDDSGNELASNKRGLIIGQFRWITNFIFGQSKEINIPLVVQPSSQFFDQLARVSIVGQLKIVVDTYQSGYSFLYRAGIIMLSGLFRNMLLVLFLLIFFHYYLTRPFLKLEHDLDEIDPHNPHKHRLTVPKGHENDEFNILVNDTNDLLETIENDIDERIKKVRETERLRVEIIEREQKEQELKEYQEQLELVNDGLSNTLERLSEAQDQLIQSEKMASLGELVAGIAHEINTPVGIGLTAASHFNDETQSILKQKENGKITEAQLEEYFSLSEQISQMILSNMERASNLVKSFKQIAVDQSSEERRYFRVREYIDEVLLSLKYVINKSRHKITIQSEGPVEMHSFPGSFAQVITNLLMNSITHAYDPGQPGHIVMDFKKVNENLHFKFIDDGKGIPKKNLKKIFDPFYTTKRKQGGTGLGLHIVYNLVTQTLGGQIQCYSEENQGTTFIIKIPITPEQIIHT